MLVAMRWRAPAWATERYWRFQITEAAIVLGILAAALALGLVGLRRRVP